MTDSVSHPQRGLFVARETTRLATLCLAVGIAIACAGCESETDRKARETEALQAKYNAAVKAENLATARALAELARADREASSARAIETRAESDEAFARYVRERPSMTDAEESTATELGVLRLRSRMADPESMQLRNAHMNGARNAMCAEVNYKQDGNYVGFRRAYVTVDAVSVEPAAEEVTHRVFDLNFKRIGCDSPAARS